MRANPLLAVVGMPGAGKSTAVEHLATREWPVVYFGKLTLDEIERRGLAVTADSERQIRESLRGAHGEAAYAKLSLPAIVRHLGDKPTLIDGLYSWAEYTFLRAELRSPMYVLAICAERRRRYERLSQRANRPLAAQEAQRRDIAEIENIDKGGPIAIADFTVVNDGTAAELCASLDAIADRILAAAGDAGPTA